MIDEVPEKKVPPTPPQENNWTKDNNEKPAINKYDASGIGDLSDGSNISKFVMTTKVFNFMDNTTMHGMRYIFMRNISQARRLIWFIVVLAGMGYWYYVFSETLRTYLQYPTITRISTVYEKQSEFPAVTLCNYNSISKSKVTLQERSILSHIFAQYPLPPNLNLSDYDHVNLKEFFTTKGTSYDLSFCYHKGLLCKQSLFSLRLTDFGLCATFDPGDDEKSKYQNVRGFPGGFYFGASYPHSEWTMGPFFGGEGLRFKAHKTKTLPVALQYDGISLMSGLSSDVIITRHEVTLLPPPYGKCGSRPLNYFSNYTRENCLTECQTKHAEKICGCKLYFMPGNAKMCTWNDMATCHNLLKFPPNDSFAFDASICGCPRDCHSTYYDAHLTQVKLSEGYSKIIRYVYLMNISEVIALRLFYQDLYYKEEVEEPVYSTEKLLCDVGGAAGLFLGCSFITVMEICDFLFEAVWFLCTKGALLRKQKSLKLDLV